MKNKKSIAMAMTAVSTLGAVAPAFANQVAPRLLEASDLTVDYRLANGEELVTKTEKVDGKDVTKVLVLEGRENLYNDNFTPNDRTDDIFKKEYKDAQIFMSRLTKDKDDKNDLFVLVKKSEDESKVAVAKTKLDVMIAEIEAAKKVEGTKVEVKELKKANITTKTFSDSEIQVVVTDADKNVRTYVFTGVPGIEEEEEVLVNPFLEEFKSNITVNAKVVDMENITSAEKAEYKKLNKFKLIAEKNKDKFDFETVQDGTNNENLLVNVYKKGDKQIDKNVKFTMTVQKYVALEKELVVTISENADFDGHWAQKEIEAAMLSGKVDAVSKFRPEDSITRAEFAKIVCTTFGYKPAKTDSEIFDDVSKADGWKYDYIAALYTNGQFDVEKIVDDKKVTKTVYAIQGNDGKFRPDDEITREEVAVILARVIEQDDVEVVKTVNEKDIHETVKTKFKDTKDIADWADHSVDYLSKAAYDKTVGKEKYVAQGSEGKFNPKKEITRAESLVMIERAAKAKAIK